MARTVVSFHAHPDDEAMLTSGTLARAAAEGHRVVLVFATRGDVGEFDPDLLGAGETLSQRRTLEAEASASIIGAQRVVFLDHPDSGHLPELVQPGCFAALDPEEPATRLAAVLEEERADVVTTYDPNGGYGHPDHLQVHEVGARAAEIAGTSRVLEATFDRGLLELAAQLLPTLDLGADSAVPHDIELPDTSNWYSEASAITHAIDVAAFLDIKRASMAAHASQASSDGGLFRTMATFVALPDDIFSLAFGIEWYIDPTLQASAGSSERLDDIFDGL